MLFLDVEVWVSVGGGSSGRSDSNNQSINQSINLKLHSLAKIPC